MKNTTRSRAAAADQATYEGRPMLCGHTTRLTASATCAVCAAVPKPIRSERTGARRAARAAGELFYQGAPCLHGHDGKRYVSKGQCYACQMAGSAARDHATDHARETRQAWRAANREKDIAMAAQAHSVERGAVSDGTVTAEALAALLQGQGGCAYCGSLDRLQLDHKHPISRKGHHTLANVQWLCSFHNSSKSDQTDQEYRDRYLIVDCTPWDAL